MTAADADEPAEDLAPWERNRRQRQTALEAANEHGQQLAERYGRVVERQQFASVGHAPAKRRRR
jgi:hypothetical protein